MIIPFELHCEGEYYPINLDTPFPRFSWALQAETRGQTQTAYQILVTDGNTILWDSGKVAGAQQMAAYAGVPLTSRREAKWQVRVWDKQDRPSPYSESASFRLGLLNTTDWQAEWIGYPAEWNGQALYFRRAFRIEKPPASAWVSLAGLGCYELRLNGQKVGEAVLDPGFTDYGKRVLYATYNLQPFLTPGENVFGVILGNGWYGAPKLLLQAEFEYEDGTDSRVLTGHNTTGPGWSVGTGPILENSIYGGESYDARLEIPGWDSPASADAFAWSGAVVTDAPGGKLVAQRVEPIRITDTLPPGQVTALKPSVTVFDLGQNIAGWVRLRVNARRGDRIALRFAESIYEDGNVNQENLRRARATDTYIAKGDAEETWEPSFTYHGFRYVQVEGVAEPKIEGRVVRSDTPARGTFECSHELLNRIHKMVWWTEYTNQHSIPTDCPQRDERMGWLNDMAARTEQMLYNFDVSRFLPKWLDDIHDAQSPDGAITDTAPYRWGNRPADPVSACYLLIPWQLYLHFGDTRPMEKHYPGLKAWVDYLTLRSEGNLLNYSYYGDWAPPVRQGSAGTIGDSAVSRDTPGALMSTGFYYYSARLLAQIAEVLGKTVDGRFYTNLADGIAGAYQRAFWDETSGGYGSNNQACNALSLYMGLTPEDKRERVLANLVKDIEAHDGHLTTGNLCTKYLLEALSDHEHADIAYRIATQETYPSWGYMLANGATTCWERWEKMTGGGMNSHNHPMLSSVGSWFYKYLAGITVGPDGPGFAVFNVRPRVVGNLTRVHAALKTVRGLIDVAWERQGETFTLKVAAPPGSQAYIAIPKTGNACIITEGDTILWKEHASTGAAGPAAFVNADAQSITFAIGSGEYIFKAQRE